MKQFIFGNQEYFASLDSLLNDGNCHVFNNCQLPEFCHPKVARIGFERKQTGKYFVFIDYGISAACNDEAFKAFLVNGEKEFDSIGEIKAFFHSFAKFYNNEKNSADSVILDEDKLRKIREEQKKVIPISSADVLSELKKKIFGQDNALELLSKKLAAHLNSNRQKPLVVILNGPPGVGKTFTGKNIVNALSKTTNVKYGFIEESVNTCSESFSVQKYLGAPPGYIGYNEKTVFEPVVNNPYHIIMLNEVDKANNTLLVVLMEAFDSGIFCLANGDKIDMSHCIFILTSNMAIDYNKYYSFDNTFDRTKYCRDVFTSECAHSSISRRIDEFILYSPLNEIACANIVIRFVAEALAPYEARLYKINEYLMSSILDLDNSYGGDVLGQYVVSALISKIEEDDLYSQIKNQQLILKGTIRELVVEIFKEDNDEN